MKWQGKCPECDAWNSFISDVIDLSEKKEIKEKVINKKSIPLSSLQNTKFERTNSGIQEVDRVLGGGLVDGSLNLLTGEPGIGKSTLVLQMANNFAKQKKLLYITGEESLGQIKGRADRLNINENENLNFIMENNIETISNTIKNEKPSIIIIDSIQVLHSNTLNSYAGSVQQIRVCTEQLMNISKRDNISVIIIGHVTKDGNLAGPKLLEHLVDCVLHFEGDRYQNLRILRTVKNRYGSTFESGIFDMSNEGLVEVKNPTFSVGSTEDNFGTCLTSIIEGSRAMGLEIQALTTSTQFGYPKRTASGVELNKLNLLLAVMNKYTKIPINNLDVYINLVGGFKTIDPGIDLAMICAIISSHKKKPINKLIAIGEVSLNGEIRPVKNTEKRIIDGINLGIKEFIISSHTKTIDVPKKDNIKIYKYKNISELSTQHF